MTVIVYYEVYEEGREAFYDGISRGENPYLTRSQACRDWNAGWDFAQRMKEQVDQEHSKQS